MKANKGKEGKGKEVWLGKLLAVGLPALRWWWESLTVQERVHRCYPAVKIFHEIHCSVVIPDGTGTALVLYVSRLLFKSGTRAGYSFFIHTSSILTGNTGSGRKMMLAGGSTILEC